MEHVFGSGRFTPGSVRIISVYPNKTQVIQRLYGSDPNPRGARVTWYSLPGCPKGADPVVVRVEDAFQSVPDVEAPNDPARARMHIIPANKIADDLVHHWTGAIIGTTIDAKPGIGIWDQAGDPPQEFIDELHRQQDAYFQALYHEGMGLAAANKHDQIRKDHRDACIYLGREEVWSKEMHRDDFKKCPWCFVKLAGPAIICHNCKQIVDQAAYDDRREEQLTAPTA